VAGGGRRPLRRRRVRVRGLGVNGGPGRPFGPKDPQSPGGPPRRFSCPRALHQLPAYLGTMGGTPAHCVCPSLIFFPAATGPPSADKEGPACDPEAVETHVLALGWLAAQIESWPALAAVTDLAALGTAAGRGELLVLDGSRKWRALLRQTRR